MRLTCCSLGRLRKVEVMANFRHFSQDLIVDLFKTALELGASSLEWQTAVLKGIEPAVVATLVAPQEPSLRLLSALHHLNEIERLGDGTVPFQTWLTNAISLSSARLETETLRTALAMIEGETRVPSQPMARRRGPQSLSASNYVSLQQKARDAVLRMNELAARLGWTSITARVDDIRDALCQDAYRVAITGKSRAGKSTLVNALVGRRLCPVQQVTTTAVPIIIGPGEPERLAVSFEDRQPLFFDGPVEAAHLTPYADQRHNPDNRKRVTTIGVELANDVLALGIQYVDIPGFDDPNNGIAAATSAAIASSHALVLVIEVASFATGSFSLDMQTIKFIKSAKSRACTLFVVCNKADVLKDDEREQVRVHVRQKLEEFGLWPMLAASPFFISAKDAVDARERGAAEPRPYEEFADALWRNLWNSEESGLRRLRRVFEQLRLAGDEAATLIAVRDAKGPERERLGGALRECREESVAVKDHSHRAIESLRRSLPVRVSAVARAQTQAIHAYLATLRPESARPRPSQAIEDLRASIAPLYAQIIDSVGKELNRLMAPVEPRILRSLATLRAQVALPPEEKRERTSLLPTEEWYALARPGSLSDSWATERKMWAGGVAAGAGGIGVLLAGGPLGWALAAGGLAWGIGRWAVETIADSSDSIADLETRLGTHFAQRLSDHQARLDSALTSFGETLELRVTQKTEPFMSDMRARLDEIRPPSQDERDLYGALRQEIRQATELLTETFQAASAERDPPSETEEAVRP